jgi:uncharacterized protein
MAKKLIFIIPLIVVVIATAYFIYESTRHRNGNAVETQQPTATPTEPRVQINDTSIIVEIADTDKTRERGLSGREELPENTGMLFDFKDMRFIPVFWMKDMNFPLDMIWIKDGKIVQITRDVPAPDPETPDSALPKYSPNQIVDYVLEVNAGFSERNNINVGDEVELNY